MTFNEFTKITGEQSNPFKELVKEVRQQIDFYNKTYKESGLSEFSNVEMLTLAEPQGTNTPNIIGIGRGDKTSCFEGKKPFFNVTENDLFIGYDFKDGRFYEAKFIDPKHGPIFPGFSSNILDSDNGDFEMFQSFLHKDMLPQKNDVFKKLQERVINFFHEGEFQNPEYRHKGTLNNKECFAKFKSMLIEVVSEEQISQLENHGIHND